MSKRVTVDDIVDELADELMWQQYNETGNNYLTEYYREDVLEQFKLMMRERLGIKI